MKTHDLARDPWVGVPEGGRKRARTGCLVGLLGF